MKPFIHIIADLAVPDATPTTLQIEAAQVSKAQAAERTLSDS